MSHRMLRTCLMPGSRFGSAQCLVCNAKSNPNQDSSGAFGGAGEFSSPNLRQCCTNALWWLGNSSLQCTFILQGAGDRQSHPFPALGPRDDAGGQLRVSALPDALNSPANSLPSPLGGLPWWPRDTKPLLSHWGCGDQQKMVWEANSASFEQRVSGTGIVLLIANLTHFRLLENEQLPAVNGFLVKTLV